VRRTIYQTWDNRKYILDAIGKSPVAAYSLRSLNKAYKGKAIRVRRSIDNNLLDIGFTSGKLDTATLLAFCGGGDGFVETWYDRVFGRHLVQPNPAAQPQIVFSGVVSATNGMPGVYFYPQFSMSSPPALTTLAELDMILVHKETIRRENIVFDFTGSTSIRGAAHIPWSDGVYYFDIGNVTSTSSNWRVNTPTLQQLNKLQVVEMNHSTAANYKSIVVDGSTLASGVATVPTVACTQFKIGVSNFEGFLSEILIYDRLLTLADRAVLTRNIQSYHKI
jgi:hypothetical protein